MESVSYNGVGLQINPDHPNRFACDSILKSLMRAMVYNEDSVDPLCPGELVVRMMRDSGRLDELVKYANYEAERKNLIVNEMTYKDGLGLGGPGIVCDPNYTNEYYEISDEITLPAVARDFVMLFNLYVKYHDDNPRYLKEDSANPIYGFSWCDGKEIDSEDRGKFIDVLYMFYWERKVKL